MKLSQYEKQVEEIENSARLTPQEKRAALELTAKEIRSCAWNGNVKQAARELAAECDQKASRFPSGGLSALDSLAKKGLLARV